MQYTAQYSLFTQVELKVIKKNESELDEFRGFDGTSPDDNENFNYFDFMLGFLALVILFILFW